MNEWGVERGDPRRVEPPLSDFLLLVLFSVVGGAVANQRRAHGILESRDAVHQRGVVEVPVREARSFDPFTCIRWSNQTFFVVRLEAFTDVCHVLHE